MKIIKVPLKHNGYSVMIGHQILVKLGGKLKSLGLGKDALIITSPVIKRLQGAKVIASLRNAGFSVKVFEVPDGERSKSFKVAMGLLERIARYDVLKQPFVVALGGGVIGDLAGFVAATYKRGIPYVQVPTTFLAQIDSAIGGKVAIDLSVGKNLVGAFYQPKLVFSDTAVLETLPARQMKNGMAEAIKYGVIYDRELFCYLQKRYSDVIQCEQKVLQAVVARCSQIKVNVVMADEKETKGIRTILNFGHTIGHAIEAAGGFKVYQHGEAIALGMRAAIDLSVQLKLLKDSDARQVIQLIEDVQLPTKVVGGRVKISDVMLLMKHDKKFVAGMNRFVLATKIGKVKVVTGVKQAFISQSIRNLYK